MIVNIRHAAGLSKYLKPSLQLGSSEENRIGFISMKAETHTMEAVGGRAGERGEGGRPTLLKVRRPVLILGGTILSAPERGTDSLSLVLYRDEFLGRVLIISNLNWEKNQH